MRLEGSVFDEPSLSALEAPALEERLLLLHLTICYLLLMSFFSGARRALPDAVGNFK